MEECERWTEQLSARLDGELSPEEERELEAHLAVCPSCRALAKQLEALDAGLQDLEEAPAPEGFARGVMDRIAAEEKKPRVIPLFRRPQFRALAGLAACAALCIGLYGAGVLPGRDVASEGPQVSAYGVEREDQNPQIRTYDSEGARPHADASLAGGDGPQLQSEDGGADASAFQAKVVFDRLPEGWEELFPGADSIDGAAVSGEQARALVALLEEQGITCAVEGDLSGDGMCQLLLAEG